MKVIENIDFKVLENYGFIRGSSYYFMYNPLWEGTAKQLQIDRFNGEIKYINGEFEKGKKVLKMLEEAKLIEV